MAKDPTHETILSRLISAGININTLVTPLTIAAAVGAAETVKAILGKKIYKSFDVNLASDTGVTPLSAAGINGYTDIVALLKNHSTATTSTVVNPANVEFQGASSVDTLMHTMLSKHSRSDHCSKSHRQSLLHIAAAAADINLLLFLIDNNADITLKTENQYTPLHLAVMSGHTGIVKLLIDDFKCDVNATYQQKRGDHCARTKCSAKTRASEQVKRVQ